MHAFPMHDSARAILRDSGGFATTAELLTVMTRQELDVQVKNGGLVRVWYGVYAVSTPAALVDRLTALDVFIGKHSVACMGTAAALYGFDLENVTALHVLDPGVRLRSAKGLTVHQRSGAPLASISGRLATAPAWTAVEVARELTRPRRLATLDAALHSMRCSRADLAAAVVAQRGRRGIVGVRDLLRFADGRAESAMEIEARLVMIDGGLPLPELQYEIIGLSGECWRLDFAWPDERLAAEYESIEWHAGPAELRRDRRRLAGIQETGYTVVPILVEDVRRYPGRLVDRIQVHLDRFSQLAG